MVKKMTITKKIRRSGEIYFVARINTNSECFGRMEDAMAWLKRMRGYETISEEIVYEEEI